MIQQKLEQFIKKYYTSALIKGILLFIATGLLYLLITLLVEYFLWLSTTGRTVLFWTFVGVELALFIKFIAIPLAHLFKLQKGLSFEEASKIIGAHFPAVNDKLLNVIQLNQNQRESELLAASIDQKAKELQPIPFKTAIKLTTNLKYLKYVAIPILLYALISFFSDSNIFSSSYTRVVNYNTAYTPPAPFQFKVLNTNLEAIAQKEFILQVKIEGNVLPDQVEIVYNDASYFLRQELPGQYTYRFVQPINDINFYLQSGSVKSSEYQLVVIPTPSLLQMEMTLDYPAYTGKKDEVLQNSGNAIVPEGTKIGWSVQTKNTNEVAFKTPDSTYAFSKNNSEFTFSKPVYSKLNYTVTTSNDKLKEYENLSFTLSVVKDAYPEITLESTTDSLQENAMYFLGTLSDDYGISKLQLVYYKQQDITSKNTIEIPINKSTIDQFTYHFPNNLDLETGLAYDFYFEVFDNDAIHQYKSTKSSVFTYRKLTQEEIENQQLQQQQETIEGLDKSLEDRKEQEKRLEEISKTQKEKETLNWNDKKKLEELIKQQKLQDEMMEKFSEEMQENLEKFQPEDEEDPFKEALKERFEENEEQQKKNEKLLEELEKLQDKIKKEELTQKLEKLAKNNKNQEKNLEQLLELTKRYYVTKKAEKLAEDLQKLAEKQEKLAQEDSENNTTEKQEELNKEFEEYQKEMDELQEENKKLKEPMDIPQDKSAEEEVKQEQKDASKNLDEQKTQDAQQNQKKAAKKMKQMGEQLQMQMQAGQMETMEEDIEMLRQILDNLVVFSFEQENLLNDFKKIDYGSPVFGKKLIRQNELKQNFEHIDDSIFALSLRQAMISGKVTEEITKIQFNLDKSMERLAENIMQQGISSQQYVVTGANELAVLLSDLLNGMQNQMSASGSGTGKGKPGQGQGGGGFQLPDIIEKQKSLSEQMQEGMQEGGKQGSEGEGQEGQGEGEGEGENEGSGSGDGSGTNGSNSNNGSDGNSNGDSENSNGELYEIYKQQQQLRQQLQDRLSKEGLQGAGGELLKKMEGIEQQLLDKGFHESVLQQMQNLEYELLKLDKADLEQGKDTKRKSKTNTKDYINNAIPNDELIKKYFNTTEILNRETLPLQPKYKQKVKEYFKEKDD